MVFTNLYLPLGKTHYIIQFVGSTAIKCLQGWAFEFGHQDIRTHQKSVTSFIQAKYEFICVGTCSDQNKFLTHLQAES